MLRSKGSPGTASLMFSRFCIAWTQKLPRCSMSVMDSAQCASKPQYPIWGAHS